MKYQKMIWLLFLLQIKIYFKLLENIYNILYICIFNFRHWWQTFLGTIISPIVYSPLLSFSASIRRSLAGVGSVGKLISPPALLLFLFLTISWFLLRWVDVRNLLMLTSWLTRYSFTICPPLFARTPLLLHTLYLVASALHDTIFPSS